MKQDGGWVTVFRKKRQNSKTVSLRDASIRNFNARGVAIKFPEQLYSKQTFLFTAYWEESRSVYIPSAAMQCT